MSAIFTIHSKTVTNGIPDCCNSWGFFFVVTL
nr:MAG TPA: hypothetical protein [Caudoviricetes sp.]